MISDAAMVMGDGNHFGTFFDTFFQKNYAQGGHSRELTDRHPRDVPLPTTPVHGNSTRA